MPSVVKTSKNHFLQTSLIENLKAIQFVCLSISQPVPFCLYRCLPFSHNKKVNLNRFVNFVSFIVKHIVLKTANFTIKGQVCETYLEIYPISKNKFKNCLSYF